MNDVSDNTATTFQPVAASTLCGEQRIVLDGISWNTYETLLDEIQNGGVRLAYDHGRLEIMSPSLPHEKYKRLLGRMIEILAEELDLPINSGGSTTFRREELLRGIEPDECYWLLHASDVAHNDTIDLSVDPPPDLAIEVDITSSSLDKMVICAALQIPEVWRFDGRDLHVQQLQRDGTYLPVSASPSFPNVPLDTLAEYLALRSRIDERQWVKEFRQWVRDEFVSE